MNPITLMFTLSLIMILVISIAVTWLVEEMWGLLLLVLVLVAAVYVRKWRGIDKRMKKIRATEIVAVDGIMREVYEHQGYSVDMLGFKTHYYGKELKETGRMITFKLYYKNGTVYYETAKEGSYLCDSLKRLLDKSPKAKKPWALDTTPIFKDHEGW